MRTDLQSTQTWKRFPEALFILCGEPPSTISIKTRDARLFRLTMVHEPSIIHAP